jgi:hypothetical protein
LNFVVAGTDASGELTIAPTLWAKWNGWVKAEIIRHGFVTVYDAIHEAARVLKASTGYGSSVTTRRYLKEAVGDNKHGDFVKAWNTTHGNVITFSEKFKKRFGLD